MKFTLLSAAYVSNIHDAVLNLGELEGIGGGKSIDAVLSRVEFRVQYGMIADEVELAAMYAVAIARGHIFNDANKRTAYLTMVMCLALNGVELVKDDREIGDLMIAVAEGKVDELQLAQWLREHIAVSP